MDLIELQRAKRKTKRRKTKLEMAKHMDRARTRNYTTIGDHTAPNLFISLRMLDHTELNVIYTELSYHTEKRDSPRNGVCALTTVA